MEQAAHQEVRPTNPSKSDSLGGARLLPSRMAFSTTMAITQPDPWGQQRDAPGRT
jgi:hypothetical protein